MSGERSIIDRPQEGWFRTRLVKGGPLVPARIWRSVATDPLTGEALDRSPILQAEINGKPIDPYELWPRVADRRITEAEFKFMTADSEWCQRHAPNEPAANPGKPIDLRTAPIPF